MPIALKQFGLELNRVHQEREKLLIGTQHRLGGRLRDLLDGLDANVLVFVNKLARRIYMNGRLNRDEWLRIRRQVLNVEIMTPFHKFREAAVKTTKQFQKAAFSDTVRRHRQKFKQIYPNVRVWKLSKKRYRELLQGLEFMDSKLELEFLRSGREVTEAVYFEEMLRIREVLEARNGNGYNRIELSDLIPVEISEAPIPPVRGNMPKGSINLVLGTGKLNDDFLMFLERQLEVGLDPANLITTFGTEHIARMQGVLLDNVRHGLDVGAARKEFMSGLMKDMTTGEERRRLASNSMRIMRTAHQRAAASATSLWGLQNRDLITGLVRVADGRPCFTAGHHVETPDGTAPIETLNVGDIVFSGKQKPTRIAQTHKTEYSGELIVIELENGAIIKVTPNHGIYVLRDGKEAKIPASELQESDDIVEKLS